MEELLGAKTPLTLKRWILQALVACQKTCSECNSDFNRSIYLYNHILEVLHLKYRRVLTWTSITIHPFSKFFSSKVREIDLLWANFGQLLLQRLKTFLKGFRWLDKECTWGNGLGTWRSLFWQHGNSLKSVCAFFSLRNFITGL